MFEKFSKIPRLNKPMVITEKLDGTNAQVHIVDAREGWPDEELADMPHLAHEGYLYMFAGSRNRYLTLDDDNFGFARWVEENNEELFKFGPGRHYGEWWGMGIQRTYGLEEKRFSMFNPRWVDMGPSCVDTVPVLGNTNDWDSSIIETCFYDLKQKGSVAAPGFMDPEGIIVYHSGTRQLFKQTYEYDGGKWSE